MVVTRSSNGCTEARERSGTLEALALEIEQLDRMIDEGRTELVCVSAARMIATGAAMRHATDLAGAQIAIRDALARLDGRTDIESLVVRGDAWFALAETHDDAGETPAAADCYGHALEARRLAYTRSPTTEIVTAYATTANRLGLQCATLGRLDPALTAYDTALAIDRLHPDAMPKVLLGHLSLNRGNALHDADRNDEALVAYERALADYAADAGLDARRCAAFAWLGRGNIVWKQDRRDEARRSYLKTIELLESLHDLDARHSSAQAEFNLAVSDGIELRWDAALAHLARAIELMSEIVERNEDDAYAGDLVLYRATRARWLATAGTHAAALDEMRAACATLREIIARSQNPAFRKALDLYEQDIATWTAELERQRETRRTRAVPIVHRAGPPQAPKPPDPHEFRCSFCRRARSEVRKLISGPRVFICDSCVVLATEFADKACPRNARGARAGEVQPGPTCNFCEKSEARAFVQGPNIVICDECVDLCIEIIEEEIEKQAAADDRVVCAFCTKPRAEVRRLVVSNDVAICDACFAAALAAIEARFAFDSQAGKRAGLRLANPSRICAWCDESVARMFVGPPERPLCDACIDAARSSFAES